MSKNANELLLSGINIHIEKASNCENAISSALLGPVAKSFVKNVNDIHNLLILPQLVLAFGFLNGMANFHFLMKASVLGISEDKKLSDADLTTMKAEYNKFWDPKREGNDKTIEFILDKANSSISEMLENDEVRDSIRSLLASATTAGWTAFEYLSTDLWVEVLNTRPKIAQHTFSSVTDEKSAEGLTSKNIPVRILSKYNFNLQQCMGTLLKPKFDFTGVDGIHKAYVAAFEKDAALHNIFQSTDLKLLEAVRHLNVHRSGIVDEEFKNRSNLNVNIGDILPLDGATVSRLVNASIEAGCNLLCHVDHWLAIHPE